MPKLKIKKPCNDCPFRRNAFPGWLGASGPEQFMLSTHGEEHMPCHKTINYHDPSWAVTQMPEAAFCAGGLIFFANYLKAPRDPELYAAVQAVERDPNIFAHPEEFLAYHGAEVEMVNYHSPTDTAVLTKPIGEDYLLEAKGKEPLRFESADGWMALGWRITDPYGFGYTPEKEEGMTDEEFRAKVAEVAALTEIERPVKEHDGWTFGERVRVIEDDEDHGLYQGSEGILVIEMVGAAEYNNERVHVGFLEDDMDTVNEIRDFDCIEAI